MECGYGDARNNNEMSKEMHRMDRLHSPLGWMDGWPLNTNSITVQNQTRYDAKITLSAVYFY